MNPVALIRDRAQLTQAELAQRAGTSQPTIAAYESGTKSPTLRTLERLAASAGLELHPLVVPAMTREERRSLALHRVIANRLAADPSHALAIARRNLRQLARAHPGARPLWKEWRRALDLPTEHLVDVLVDPRPLAREMRQVTPFAGVLSPSERWDVYRRFHAEERARAA